MIADCKSVQTVSALAVVQAVVPQNTLANICFSLATTKIHAAVSLSNALPCNLTSCTVCLSAFCGRLWPIHIVCLQTCNSWCRFRSSWIASRGFSLNKSLCGTLPSTHTSSSLLCSLSARKALTLCWTLSLESSFSLAMMQWPEGVAMSSLGLLIGPPRVKPYYYCIL